MRARGIQCVILLLVLKPSKRDFIQRCLSSRRSVYLTYSYLLPVLDSTPKEIIYSSQSLVSSPTTAISTSHVLMLTLSPWIFTDLKEMWWDKIFHQTKVKRLVFLIPIWFWVSSLFAYREATRSFSLSLITVWL